MTIVYGLKMIVISGLFLVFYKLILERDNSFIFNRIFLLTGLLGAVFIPLIEIESRYSGPMPMLPKGLLEMQSHSGVVSTPDQFNWAWILTAMYILISLVLIGRVIWLSYNLITQSRQNKTVSWNGIQIVLLNKNTVPFSFGNKIYVNEESYKEGMNPQLLHHEKAHIDQYHTLDILLLELLHGIFWFNPVIILYKKSIKLNHEFLADRAVLTDKNELINYQYLLLKMSRFTTNACELSSHFNFSITKKRFNMMNKTTSMERSILNGALSIGFCLLLCISFSNKITAQAKASGATQEELKEFIKLAQAKGETPHIDIKVITKEDAERYMEIKMKMTNEQKEMYAEYKLPPPPPPSKGAKSPLPDNVQYYINGKKASAEEVEKLTPDLIESVDVNKQKEIPEIRITLKS